MKKDYDPKNVIVLFVYGYVFLWFCYLFELIGIRKFLSLICSYCKERVCIVLGQ